MLTAPCNLRICSFRAIGSSFSVGSAFRTCTVFTSNVSVGNELPPHPVRTTANDDITIHNFMRPSKQAHPL
jgi:hypothetical protein